MKKLFTIIFFSIILAGCAVSPFFGERVTSLNPGDSREAVIKTIGKPDGFIMTQNGYVLKYIHKMVSGFNYQYTDYYLFFDKKDQLISVQNGEITDNTQNVTNSLNAFNQQLNTQQQLELQRRQIMINSINANKAQRIIICKPGDLLCY